MAGGGSAVGGVQFDVLRLYVLTLYLKFILPISTRRGANSTRIVQLVRGTGSS